MKGEALMLEWLSENIFSILILIATVAVLGFLAFRMYKDHKAAKASSNPGCFGCPNAKKCSGGCHCTVQPDESTPNE